MKYCSKIKQRNSGENDVCECVQVKKKIEKGEFSSCVKWVSDM